MAPLLSREGVTPVHATSWLYFTTGPTIIMDNAIVHKAVKRDNRTIYQCSILDPELHGETYHHTTEIASLFVGETGGIVCKTARYSRYEWLMIDASHAKVHPHAVGAKGGNQEHLKRTEK